MINKKFEVSVVIPVYNAAKFLIEAINSALSQEQVKEILLVEDGSLDGSLNICRELSQRYSKIRLLQHPSGENRGASASRNLGIRKAQCPYVSFLDADDYFLPNRFQKTQEIFFKRKDIDGVYEAVGISYQDDDARHLYKKVGKREITTIYKDVAPEHLFKAFMQGGIGHFHLNGFTVLKGVFDAVSFFNEEFDIGEDTLLSFQLSAKSRLIAGNIQNPVAVRRVHSNNRITHHMDDKRRAYVSMLELWVYFMMWGERNLSGDEYKWILRRYISQLRTIDQVDNYQLSDFFESRKKIFVVGFEKPSLFGEIFFWRRLLPQRNVFVKNMREY